MATNVRRKHRIKKSVIELEVWMHSIEFAVKLASTIHEQKITSEAILESYIYRTSRKNRYDWGGDVYGYKIKPKILFDVILDENIKNYESNSFFISEEFLPKGIYLEYKVAVKQKNKKWTVHKNDKDPFPSNPHAHCSESGCKLDLGTRKIYKRRKQIGRVSKKTFIELRKSLLEKGVDLPDLKV